MFTLINPDIAYLLIMFGTLLLMLALVTPGTHLLEGGALALLAGAGYEVFKLGFNWWALVILILALVPFIYSIRRSGRGWALVVAILALVVGSLYLFPGTGLLPAVNPVLAVVVSLLSGGFLWIVVRNGWLAIRAKPLQDLQNLVGMTGQAKTAIHAAGSAQVASELWSARSEEPIQAGSRVRVIAREGFTLVVEPGDQVKK
jgi:membrane-bound serine protease (ClpP class)